MGKKMTKKRKSKGLNFRSKRVQTVAVFALVALCAGALAGMAALNGSAKPHRDMRWYVQEGDVQIAAPAAESAYVTADYSLLDGREGGAQTLPRADGTDEPTAGPTIEATRTPRPTSQLPTQAPTPSPVPVIDAVTITVTAAGDCTLGGDTNTSGYKRFQSAVKKNGYDYFLKGFRSLFEADDLTIVNLEGPLTTSNDKRSGRKFNFKGDPANVAILAGSSVEVCNVANNHALDFGKSGLKQTAEVLTAAGIGWSGYGKIHYTQIKGVRVASLGFTEWDFETDVITAAVAEARRNSDLVIVSVHWGDEMDYTAGSRQKKLGRAIVDAGADLVLGTHPHVVQGIELYHGKYIVYSLGNFCFGGNSNPSDKRCLVFQQAFSFTTAGGLVDAGINLIPASVSSSGSRNDFQPTVLSAKQGSGLLKLVAKDSSGFSAASALWMPDNYLVKAGLMTLDADVPAAEAPDETDEADDAGAAEAPTWEQKLRQSAGT